MVAYEILESERCPRCGMYRWICANDDKDIQFRLEVAYCGATARADKARIANENKTNYTPPPGESLRPQPYTVSGVDLVHYREPYYKALATKKRAVEETSTRGT